MQNADKSSNTGIEFILSDELTKWYSININLNTYYTQIDDFTVVNKYPVTNTFKVEKQEMISGNLKVNNTFKLFKNVTIQVIAIYLAPDIIPQGKIGQRFTLDLGIKKTIQKGKGEMFFNATDLLNTMSIKKEIKGSGFNYVSTDYYETQVIRVGYNYKF